jgi:SAM-dependent methyltransferase
MPDLESNKSVWAEHWDWSREGDEWSDWWGGTHAMWLGALQPRLQSFVPTGRILEIAPGFGRWTSYLKDLADELVVVDLTEQCIEHCKERFADATNITYHVNDGRSLAMVDDDAFDLVVSFDSLVHADSGVLEAYVRQLAKKLRPDGVGLLHHSNAGSLERITALAKRLPAGLRRRLIERGRLPDLSAWRDEGMSAARFVSYCEAVGLRCIGQETFSWERGPFLTDAFSLFTPVGSRWDRPHRVLTNPGFEQEGRRMRELWSPRSFQT